MGLVYIEDGGDPGFFVQFNDVTGLRTAEQALRDSEARYRAFFEDHPVAMYRTTAAGEILEANDALARLSGHESPEQLSLVNVRDIFVEPSERVAMLAEVARTGSLVGFDFEMRKSDGSSIWVRDSSRQVRKHGRMVYEGALFDVTKRYEAEAELRSRALQQAAVSALGQLALQTHDPHALAISAVRMSQEVLAMDSVALLRGDPLSTFARWDSQDVGTAIFDEVDAEWFGEQLPDTQESVVVDAAPHRGHVALIAVPDVDGGTAVLVAASSADPELTDDDMNFLQAVSAVVAATIERNAAQMRLEALISSKDEFIASISHEVRTPLTVVMGLSHELQDRWSEMEPTDREELLGLIVAQTQEMQDLVEDLLVAARADIGKLPIHLEPMDTGPAIAAALSSVHPPAGVELTVSPHSPTCYADPVRFRQIVRNLATNAFRYGGDRVEIVVNHDDDRVWVEVVDNGIGVAIESRESIFEAYERAHRSAGKPGSVGLGLTVSRKLARLMDGDLTYRFDGRSVFTLELAAAPRLMFWNDS